MMKKKVRDNTSIIKLGNQDIAETQNLLESMMIYKMQEILSNKNLNRKDNELKHNQNKHNEIAQNI